ncbi:MAG: LacI family transcriptional regulator [Planctomycetota bacterium]|nr:MAG: LacI family transcriptional regulator [Planctomycetota bacterium]
MQNSKKKTTMKDVASQAGVSVATVSAVLNERNGRIPVSDKTRAAVLLAVKKLNYRLNEQARSLRTGKSHTIGIVASDITQPFSGQMLRLIEQQVHERGYHFLLSDIQNNKEREKFYLNLFSQKRVDGILFVGASSELDDEDISHLAQRDIPIVLTEREVCGSNVPCILVDNIKGAALATEHLVRRDRRSIAYITGPEGNVISQQRSQGYGQVLRENGLSFSDKLIVQGGLGLEDGCRAMGQLLDKTDAVDGVFAFNDMVAIGAMKAIRDKGLKVAGDIAVVGFDDIPIAAYCEPPLTTVRQPVVDMCVQGVDLLLDILDEKLSRDHFTKTVLEPELIVRKSCGNLN